MALPDSIGLEAATNRISDSGVGNIAAGANELYSTPVDNKTNLDNWCDIEITGGPSVAPTAGTVLEVYLLYSLDDGTTYEDGSGPTTTVDPIKNPIGVMQFRADTSSHKRVFDSVVLAPYKFKILLKSELDQAVYSVGIVVKTHKNEITD